MTVKVFTGSGQLSVKDDKKPTANRASYIQATGGDESIVKTYEKLSHPYCGTPKCCGMCKTADKSVSELLQDGFREEQKEDEPEYMDEDYSKELERFFKGRAL